MSGTPGAPPITYTIAHERSFDVTTLVANGRRKFSDDGGAPRLACAYVLKADDDNSVDVLVGEGTPTYPLAPGEARYSDLPPNVLVDISRLEALDATKTGNQIIHVTYWEITSNPLQTNAEPGGVPPGLASSKHNSFAGA